VSSNRRRGLNRSERPSGRWNEKSAFLCEAEFKGAPRPAFNPNRDSRAHEARIAGSRESPGGIDDGRQRSALRQRCGPLRSVAIRDPFARFRGMELPPSRAATRCRSRRISSCALRFARLGCGPALGGSPATSSHAMAAIDERHSLLAHSRALSSDCDRCEGVVMRTLMRDGWGGAARRLPPMPRPLSIRCRRYGVNR
jgi:hypothetical protein